MYYAGIVKEVIHQRNKADKASLEAKRLLRSGAIASAQSCWEKAIVAHGLMKYYIRLLNIR